LYGLSEAFAVPLEGRLFVPHPGLLIALAAALTAVLYAVPGGLIGLLGRGWPAGMAGAVVALGSTELALAVATDPPPFTEPAWYVGSPLALGLGLAALAAFLVAARRWPVLAPLGLVALCALPLAAATGRAEQVEPEADYPNVLLVTMDTTRADYIGAWGHPRSRTPVIDSLAAGGAMFERAYAQIAVTNPSHTTIHSGLGTWSHGTLLNGVPSPSEPDYLAERLGGLGYRTGAFVSAYVLEAEMGLSQGFATYDDDFSWHKGSDLLPFRILAAAKRRLAPDHVLERRGGDTVDAALGWLDQDDGPWFLWVHLFDPHGPYEPPPPYDTMFYEGNPTDPANTSMDGVKNVAVYLKDSLQGITDVDYVLAQYLGEIAYADEQIGRLIGAVEERGERGETLVVVAADHGESLGEHDVWFNHGDDVYAPSTHVPLVFNWPGRVAPGRYDALVELSDVAPTVYELLRLPALSATSGSSLVAVMDGGGGRAFSRSMIFDREANVADREAGKGAQPKWRMAGLQGADSLFVHRDHADFDDAYYLSDAPEDDVSGQHAELLGTLRPFAAQLLEQGAAGVERSAIELDEETRKQLEALGYVE